MAGAECDQRPRITRMRKMAARRVVVELVCRACAVYRRRVSWSLLRQSPSPLSPALSVPARLFRASRDPPVNPPGPENGSSFHKRHRPPDPSPPLSSQALLTGRLQMTFTCKVCETRSVKQFSRQAYQRGVVVVQCPGCQSLHLVADNLGWFDQKNRNIEDILAERGEAITRTDTSALEFRDDNTMTQDHTQNLVQGWKNS